MSPPKSPRRPSRTRVLNAAEAGIDAARRYLQPYPHRNINTPGWHRMEFAAVVASVLVKDRYVRTPEPPIKVGGMSLVTVDESEPYKRVQNLALNVIHEHVPLDPFDAEAFADRFLDLWVSTKEQRPDPPRGEPGRRTRSTRRKRL